MEIPVYIQDNMFGSAKVDPKRREALFDLLFSDYDTRYVQRNGRGFSKEFLIGRGSHHALTAIETYTLDQNVPELLKIGRMCNYGKDCTILVDGEHTNQKVINTVFGDFPFAYKLLRQSNQMTRPVTTKGNTVIGSNVLISRGATILSGVTIGDGAVIGAGAIVTKDVPPFSIAAGNPAKIIAYRFDEKIIEELLKIRWWDFEYQYLGLAE